MVTKLSIIMTYFNRKELCLATLKTMALTAYPFSDFDIQIIDDASDPEHRLEDLVGRYPMNMRIIRVEPEEKTWVEPLAMMNKTIRECESKTILFQFTECLHVGDVISYTMENIKEKTYLSFAVIYANDEWSAKARSVTNPTREEIISVLPQPLFENRDIIGTEWEGMHWHNHSIHQRWAYPYCCAFMRDDYVAMEGFDEEFANGFAGCDDDFLDRFVGNGNRIIFVDDPFVMHQYHPNFFVGLPNSGELRERNRTLLKEKRSKGRNPYSTWP
jgi:hypothetical protein